MLAAVEPLGRELPGDLFLSMKEDNDTRGIPNYCFKCENIAEVAPTFKTMDLWQGSLNNQVFTLFSFIDEWIFARKRAGE